MNRMNLTLKSELKNRYYQDNAIESALFLTKNEPHNRHLFDAPCGSGKSVMELKLLQAIPDSILITPRLEIVAGMLEKGGVFVEDMNESELANCASNYGIFTPVRLRNWLRDGKLPWVPELAIYDECFPAGSRVNTPKGYVGIENIKVGDSVISYDETSNTFVNKRVVRKFTNPAPNLVVKIKTNSRTFTCTSNHPIFTQRGWINAGTLTTNDSVYILPKTNSKVLKTKKTSEILQHELRQSNVRVRKNEEKQSSTSSRQTRFSRSEYRVSSGNRRGFTWIKETSGTRLEEGNIPQIERVESVTIQEFRNKRELRQVCSDGYVYNIEVEGTHTYCVNDIVVHNCHHSTADSWEDIEMYLNGIPTCGFTGTPYRGTPKGTERFLEKWNDTVNTVITLKETVEQGYNCLPTCEMWPLVDDDVIEITNGEISTSQADKIIVDRMEALVSRCAQFYSSRMKAYDRPTMVALPSTNSVQEFVNVAQRHRLPVAAVTQATSRNQRTQIFRQTLNCEVLLVQIDVISEGVDLPIRRLIDCKPTMSPVRWMQQVGRIMRPIGEGENPPEYICCCRNLERHCYLMQGMIPSKTIVETQQAFKIPTRRAGMRAIGLEGLGRFKTTPVTTLNGVTMSTYNLYVFDGFNRIEYFAVVHPAEKDPVIGMRKIPIVEGKADWKASRWESVPQIPDVKGCLTVREYDPTEKQQKRWSSDAAKVGLNPHEKINSRNLQTLFFFQALGVRV